MLPPIQVPEVKVAPVRSTNTASSKTTQGHSVKGAIIQVTGIADSVGLLPTQTDRAAPGRSRDLGDRGLMVHFLILGGSVPPYALAQEFRHPYPGRSEQGIFGPQALAKQGQNLPQEGF